MPLTTPFPHSLDWSGIQAELRITVATSSGPGGQNVNKTNTKVFAHWNPRDSAHLGIQQLHRVLASARVRARMNDTGEIVLSSQVSRSQVGNKKEVFAKLRELLEDALRPRKKRIRTKPTRASRQRRLESKRKNSNSKKARNWREEGW